MNSPALCESELEPMRRGLFDKRTLLDVLRHFIVFEKARQGHRKNCRLPPVLRRQPGD